MFKKLFAKKPGGTFFGNLLRVGAQKLSGGVMGQGANMVPLAADAPVAPPTVTEKIMSSMAGLASETPQGNSIISSAMMTKIKANFAWIVLGLAAAAFGIYSLVNKNKSKKFTKKRY